MSQEINIPATFICPECGEEIGSGLIRQIEHSDICKHDAPNSSIAGYWASIENKKVIEEIRKRQAEHQAKMEKVYTRMTPEELVELDTLGMRYLWMESENTRVFSFKRFTELSAFEDRMIEKYLMSIEDRIRNIKDVLGTYSVTKDLQYEVIPIQPDGFRIEFKKASTRQMMTLRRALQQMGMNHITVMAKKVIDYERRPKGTKKKKRR